MKYTTTVRVLIIDSRKPVIGVTVGLFDRDENSADDLLGSGSTNRFGEVEFHYRTRDFADDALGISDDGIKILGRDTVPDLYAVVYNRDGEAIISTRDQATHNKASLHLTVYVDQNLAAQHSLIVAAD
jgi:hypothetical protein